MTKYGLSRNWYFPLPFGMLTLSYGQADPGGIMTKFIDRVRDAFLALVEAIAGATMPQPKLIPIKVTAGKPKR